METTAKLILDSYCTNFKHKLKKQLRLNVVTKVEDRGDEGERLKWGSHTHSVFVVANLSAVFQDDRQRCTRRENDRWEQEIAISPDKTCVCQCVCVFPGVFLQPLNNWTIPFLFCVICSLWLCVAVQKTPLFLLLSHTHTHTHTLCRLLAGHNRSTCEFLHLDCAMKERRWG